MQLRHLTKLKNWQLPGVFVIALAIPVTVLLAQQLQDIRQNAQKPLPTRSDARNVPLSIYVYNDVNENGVRDIDEKGVSQNGVQVAIRSNSGKSVNSLNNASITKMTTDSQGHILYYFTPPVPQSATVVELSLTQPIDGNPTTQNPVTLQNNDLTGLHVVEFGVHSTTPPCEDVLINDDDDLALDEHPLPTPCPTAIILSGTPAPTAIACPTIATAACATGTKLKILKGGPGRCARFICQKPETTTEPKISPEPSELPGD